MSLIIKGVKIPKREYAVEIHVRINGIEAEAVEVDDMDLISRNALIEDLLKSLDTAIRMKDKIAVRFIQNFAQRVEYFKNYEGRSPVEAWLKGEEDEHTDKVHGDAERG